MCFEMCDYQRPVAQRSEHRMNLRKAVKLLSVCVGLERIDPFFMHEMSTEGEKLFHTRKKGSVCILSLCVCVRAKMFSVCIIESVSVCMKMKVFVYAT